MTSDQNCPDEILANRLALDLGISRDHARDVAFYFLQRLSEELYNTRVSEPSALLLTEDNACRLMDEFIARLDPALPNIGGGPGIVTCAGGYRYLRAAWVCLGMLRRLGCRLHAQLWHLNPEECCPQISQSFARLDVETVDASAFESDDAKRPRAGWPLKPYSIVHSRFVEVLFLDADNVCIADPTYLFSSNPYLTTGALFWPDAERIGPDREIWRLTGVPYRDEPEFETGQILLNKRRCWSPLQLTLYMNRNSSFYYRYIHGDKDTFHLAWRRLEYPYSMITTPLSRLSGVFCQHDCSGRRVFQHRHVLKWDRLDHIDGFRRESECFELCREFDSLWAAAS